MNREKYNKIIQEKFNNNIEISQNMPKDFDYKYSNKEKMKEELLKIYPDLKTEYNKDERYPFCCDFYIPSRDLFIELNGFWTHGGHGLIRIIKKI